MTGEAASIEASAMKDWIVNYITSVLDIPADPFPLADPFDSYGFDSAELVIMAGVMEEDFGVEIDPRLLFETPSVDGVVETFQKAGLVTA